MVGIVAIFFNFSDVLISGGFSSALVQKKDADDLDYSSVFFLMLSASLVVYIGLFFGAPFLASIYKQDLLVPVFRVMGLVLLINAYKSVLVARISNRLEFRKFFYSTIGGTLVSAVIGITMAMNGFGPWALVAQQMSNSIIDTLILIISTHYRPAFRISKERIKVLFGFGGRIYLASLITTLHDQIKPLIVGIKFSPTDLALYNKGEGIPSILNCSISDTLSSVLFPVISKVQDEKDEVLNITRRFIGSASFILFPIMIGLFAIADSFVSAILTDKWLPMVPYIRIFCIVYMFEIVHIGNLQAIKAIGRSDVLLKLEVIKKTSYMVILVIFILLSNSPIMLAMSTIATTVVAGIANTYPNRKLIGYKYRQQIMDLLPNLVSAMVMGFVVIMVGRIEMNSLPLMIIQILVGIVVYVLIAVVFRNENFFYLLDTAKQLLNRNKGE